MKSDECASHGLTKAKRHISSLKSTYPLIITSKGLFKMAQALVLDTKLKKTPCEQYEWNPLLQNGLRKNMI
jgi:hypothetical protein